MDIDTLFAGKERPHQLDMKINFKKFLLESQLSKKEAGLVALACAESIGSPKLAAFAEGHAQAEGATPEEINEARDAASVMNMSNLFYRFRHYVGKEAYSKPAGLRMNVMGRPVTGKPTFEMMAFAVSVLNGCQMCIQSHEASLIKHEISEDKIYDLARLASITKGLEPILRA